MRKHIIIYLLLSVLAIVFAKYTHLIIGMIHQSFMYIHHLLTPIFKGLSLNSQMQHITALILIPLTLIGIPALIYRFAKSKTMPYILESTWTLWLILVLSQILVT